MNPNSTLEPWREAIQVKRNRRRAIAINRRFIALDRQLDRIELARETGIAQVSYRLTRWERD
jgi:hypothetical protein